MKNKVILLMLMLLCLLTLTSCRCNPSEYEWSLLSITEDVAFSNGMKKEMEYNGYLGIAQPWGSRGYAERCVVEFSPDGEFKMSLDGEPVSGFYTYCHNGYTNTSFTVYLDTGESFTGVSVSGYGFRRLSFELRGVLYEFGERDDESYTLEEQKQSELEIIRYLRDTAPQGYYYFNRGKISASDGAAVLTCDNGDIIDLTSDGVYPWCVYLDKEDNLTHLDYIPFGDCCYYAYDDVVIVYFIEPVPGSEERVPRESCIGEIYPELFSDEIESVKICRETVGISPGFVNHVAYLSGDEMGEYLSALREVKLYEADEETVSNITDSGALYGRTSVTIFLQGAEYTLSFEDEYVFGDLWWECGDLPSFPYDLAASVFVTDSDEIKVYNGDEFTGSYSGIISKIEFTVCNEEHHYTTLTPRRRVVTDFGEITVYDDCHFWYKGQSYVVVGDFDFGFLFES